MDVVYITDENYAMPTGISMISLLEHNLTPLTVHIIAVNVSVQHITIWKKIASNYGFILDIKEINDDIYFENTYVCFSAGGHVTSTALYKFDLPNILNKNDKVLYLDSDIIVQGSISELWNTDLSGYYAAVVDDMGDMKTDQGSSLLGERIHLSDEHYFNSGVMLLNLQKMREDGISKKLLLYRVKEINYFMDQDAFNFVLQTNRIILPYTYNFRTPIFDVYSFDEVNQLFFNGKYSTIKECVAGQHILHLTDRLKPWQYNIPWFTQIFMDYYSKSPYKNQPLQLQSPLEDFHSIIVERDKTIENLAQQLLQDAEHYSENIKKLKAKMDWHFPREKIPEGAKVVIYGAGNVGTSFVRQLAETHYCTVALWVDGDYANKGNAVHAPEKIAGCNFDYVVVAVYNEKKTGEICSYLEQLGVSKEKIVTL